MKGRFGNLPDLLAAKVFVTLSESMLVHHIVYRNGVLKATADKETDKI